MKKRLSKSEFILAYMIIITLACFVGGFFLGAGYMKAKMEAVQAAKAEAEKEQAEKERLLRERKLYSEQDFIRFYYGVYAPLLDLKQAHFATLEQLAGKPKDEQLSALKDLAKAAEETLEQVEKDVPLSTSPLLVQAHTNYRNSIRAYLDGIEQIRSDQNSNAFTPEGIASRLTLFTNSWLKAQGFLYQALATWESVYATKRPLPNTLPETVSIQQWKQYPFHYRTYLAAEYLAQMNWYEPFNPEDLAARLDLLFRSNEAQLLGIKDVQAAMRLLQASDAVRSGDFKQLQGKLYQNLMTPEIPIYR
jgi:hypothetical protein